MYLGLGVVDKHKVTLSYSWESARNLSPVRTGGGRSRAGIRRLSPRDFPPLDRGPSTSRSTWSSRTSGIIYYWITTATPLLHTAKQGLGGAGASGCARA